MVKRSIEQNLRIKNFETKQREQRTLGDCWQWKANGHCSKADNCSFRHDLNKRAKPTQPNPSPNSFMQQNVRKASRTRSPRGKSPKWKNVSMAMQGLPQRNLKSFHSVKSGTHQNACSTSPRMDADMGKSAFMRIARLMNSLAEGLKRMVTKVQWLC